MSFPYAECAEDQIQDVVGCSCAGDFVQRAQSAVEIEQQHFVRNFVVDGQAQRFTSGCLLAAGSPKPAKKLRESLFVACPDGRVFELE